MQLEVTELYEVLDKYNCNQIPTNILNFIDQVFVLLLDKNVKIVLNRLCLVSLFGPKIYLLTIEM